MDITESTNIDLGGSFARGRSPFGDGWNQLYGFDATLRWKPLRTATYRSASFRGEFIHSSQEVLTGTENADGWSHEGSRA